MKKSILVVLYNIEKAREHEEFVHFLKNDFNIEYALINKPDSFLSQYLNENNIPVHKFHYNSKLSLISLTYSLFRLIKSKKYDIVHAHLFEATLSGMVAAWLAGVKIRIITRHNSDFHHAYFPGAVKYDKFASKLAHKVVAVSENVRNILITWEGTDKDKVVLIPHGIDPAEFNLTSIGVERVNTIRSKYDIPSKRPVIGVVSRFIYWKGLQYIIPAFIELLSTFPDAILVLVNARGPYKSEVIKLLEGLSDKSYRLIEFENDIAAMYQVFDCFVHTPVSVTAEAFGQTYIEALAAGIPSIITKSGVADEYAVHEKNCFIVDYKNSEQITQELLYVLSGKYELGPIVKNGLEIVEHYYRVEMKYDKLKQLYFSFNT